MGRVKKLGTTYYREGYAFECLQETYFATLLKIVGDDENIEEVIQKATAKKINDEPLCRIWKVKLAN